MLDTTLPTFLVTGATGFIGRSLCESLRMRNIPLKAVSRGGDSLSPPGYSLEITSYTNWQPVLQGVDVIVHLAARAHKTAEQASDAEAEYHEANYLATINLARQAAAAGVGRFVFVSTIGVNGSYTEPGKSFNEACTAQPHNAYSRSKWAAEQALCELADNTGLQVVILRPPLVYGDNAKANFLSLIRFIRSGLPIPLASLYNQRSFIYLPNLVDVLIVAARHPAAAGKTYLVSDDDAISTPDLIRTLANAMNRPCRLFPFPMNVIELLGKLIGKGMAVKRLSQSLLVDNSKIRSELGWSPPFSLRQGLLETGKGFKHGA